MPFVPLSFIRSSFSTTASISQLFRDTGTCRDSQTSSICITSSAGNLIVTATRFEISVFRRATANSIKRFK
jgi:hypothetical protein